MVVEHTRAGVPSMRRHAGAERAAFRPRRHSARLYDKFRPLSRLLRGGAPRKPGLEGRVVTRFAIDSAGHRDVGRRMAEARLPSPNVVACVVRSFYSLTFPEHDGGIVTWSVRWHSARELRPE